jgi:hypothetical protein
MRRTSTSQSLVAGLLILAMVLSITGLFGAPGAAIKIASPAAGAKVRGVLSITASVRNGGRVSYVIFGVDADRPSSTNSAPYTFELDTTVLPDGPHRIFAEAYDNYGLIAASKVITIYVRNGSGPSLQARKEPARRVASKPMPPAKKAVAASPAPAPAARVAAKQQTGARPVTVGAAAEAAGASAASPMQPARGPLPEPSRTAASPLLSAARPAALEAVGHASFTSGTASDRPPAVHPVASRIRGHTVVMNGRPVSFSVAPYVQDGRMQVSFRSLFEEAGAQVSWHGRTRIARSVKGANVVEVTTGSSIARVNGQPVDMGAKAIIQQARMIVPLRFFADVTGAALHWDRATGVASLKVSDRALAERPPG